MHAAHNARFRMQCKLRFRYRLLKRPAHVPPAATPRSGPGMATSAQCSGISNSAWAWCDSSGLGTAPSEGMVGSGDGSAFLELACVPRRASSLTFRRASSLTF